MIVNVVHGIGIQSMTLQVMFNGCIVQEAVAAESLTAILVQSIRKMAIRCNG
jgi:hypothetical protein